MFNPDELDVGERVLPVLVGVRAISPALFTSNTWTFLGIEALPIHNSSDTVQAARFEVRAVTGNTMMHTLLQVSFDPRAPWHFTRNHGALGMKRCVFIPREMLNA